MGWRDEGESVKREVARHERGRERERERGISSLTKETDTVCGGTKREEGGRCRDVERDEKEETDFCLSVAADFSPLITRHISHRGCGAC